MQYTLRNIPAAVDTVLKQKARDEHRSLNDVAVEALTRAAGLEGTTVRHRDLADVGGTWVEDPELDKALVAQRRIDKRMWTK
jgi:hypothetical protein